MLRPQSEPGPFASQPGSQERPNMPRNVARNKMLRSVAPPRPLPPRPPIPGRTGVLRAREGLWEPPQPLLECSDCKKTYRYDGASQGCQFCPSIQRPRIVEPARTETHPLRVRLSPRPSSNPRPSEPGTAGWLQFRFWIFKRDSYRCQICGSSAQDGARLEVDHKAARSKGGSHDALNLWTLCFDCNRGKRAEDL